MKKKMNEEDKQWIDVIRRIVETFVDTRKAAGSAKLFGFGMMM